eukprot:13301950-Alexandrium_andersonii.AAC.1
MFAPIPQPVRYVTSQLWHNAITPERLRDAMRLCQLNVPEAETLARIGALPKHVLQRAIAPAVRALWA